MTGRRARPDRWLSIEIDRENVLDGCDGCGMQIFDDFYVVMVQIRGGPVREYSLCASCYGRLRDEEERRERQAADELAGQLDDDTPF